MNIVTSFVASEIILKDLQDTLGSFPLSTLFSFLTTSSHISIALSAAQIFSNHRKLQNFTGNFF